MNSRVVKLLIAIVLIFGTFCFMPAQAGWQPYAWLVTIETEEIPRQFQYPGSILNPTVLARISYAQADGSNDTPYETLWFCGGKPFGLERFNNFNIDPGQSISIKVIHKTKIPRENDFKAAAKSILRIFLDIRISNSMLQTVIVPNDSFRSITNELIGDHFAVFSAPVDTPYQIAAAMFIQDEADQQTQTMCYAPNSAGY